MAGYGHSKITRERTYYLYCIGLAVSRKSNDDGKKYFIPVFYTNTFISDNCFNGKKILSSSVLGQEITNTL